MIKKNIFLLIYFFINISFLFPKIEIYFIYKGNDYLFSPVDNKSIVIEPFDAIRLIDQSQIHRVLLTSIEKSRFQSLFYVGDKFEFNNIELELVNKDKYQVTDKLNGYKIAFSIGRYDDIIIESSLNFKDKEFNILDKIATVFTAKYLIRKMAEKVNADKETEITNKGQLDLKVQAEYNKFIEELKLLKPAEALNYITKYAELNFTIIPKKDITDDWAHPSNVYFYKAGDYKSLAFFYYYSLKQAGFNVRSYLVANLMKKNDDDINYLRNLFDKKYKPGENLKRIQELELQYSHVNNTSNIKNFFDDYLNSKLKKPPALFFYYPPDFESSDFLITVQLDEKWLYTTGNKWVDADIKNAPERACSHYARNGCYYSYIEKDFAILNNAPFTEKDIIWDVYYGSK